MLIDPRGKFLSQRTHPQLARILPEITADALMLHAPDLPALRVPLDSPGEEVPVQVCGRTPASAWIRAGPAHEWVEPGDR